MRRKSSNQSMGFAEAGWPQCFSSAPAPAPAPNPLPLPCWQFCISSLWPEEHQAADFRLQWLPSFWGQLLGLANLPPTWPVSLNIYLLLPVSFLSSIHPLPIQLSLSLCPLSIHLPLPLLTPPYLIAAALAGTIQDEQLPLTSS